LGMVAPGASHGFLWPMIHSGFGRRTLVHRAASCRTGSKLKGALPNGRTVDNADFSARSSFIRAPRWPNAVRSMAMGTSRADACAAAPLARLRFHASGRTPGLRTVSTRARDRAGSRRGSSCLQHRWRCSGRPRFIARHGNDIGCTRGRSTIGGVLRDSRPSRSCRCPSGNPRLSVNICRPLAARPAVDRQALQRSFGA